MATPTFWVPYIHINDINNMLLDIGGTPDAEQIPGQPHCFDIPCVLPNNQYAAMSVRVDESSKQSVINVIAAKSFLEFDIAFSSSVVAIGGKCSRRMKVNAILLGESSSVCRFISDRILGGPNDLWIMPIRSLYSQQNFAKRLSSHIRSGGGPCLLVAYMHGINSGRAWISIYIPPIFGGPPSRYLEKIAALTKEAETEGLFVIRESTSP